MCYVEEISESESEPSLILCVVKLPQYFESSNPHLGQVSILKISAKPVLEIAVI